MKILHLIFFLLYLQIPVPAASGQEVLYNYSNNQLVLIPDLEEAESVQSFINNKPDYAVELLYQFPLSDPVDWNDLYFKLRGISRLEEIRYFSERIHKNRKMFENAYLVESSRSKKGIPDFSDSTEFKNETVFAFLNEVVLGKGFYRIKYEITADSISFTLQNVSKLSRIIKIVEEDNFYLKFIFYKRGNILNAYLFGAYTLENKPLVEKVLKYPYSTLSKRVYTVFVKLLDGFHGIELSEGFPAYLRES